MKKFCELEYGEKFKFSSSGPICVKIAENYYTFLINGEPKIIKMYDVELAKRVFAEEISFFGSLEFGDLFLYDGYIYVKISCEKARQMKGGKRFIELEENTIVEKLNDNNIEFKFE